MTVWATAADWRNRAERAESRWMYFTGMATGRPARARDDMLPDHLRDDYSAELYRALRAVAQVHHDYSRRYREMAEIALAGEQHNIEEDR